MWIVRTESPPLGLSGGMQSIQMASKPVQNPVDRVLGLADHGALRGAGTQEVRGSLDFGIHMRPATDAVTTVTARPRS